jgi:hypothetical protein
MGEMGRARGFYPLQ